MRPFVKFGKTGIKIVELFAWQESDDGDEVQVFSRHTAVVPMVGPDAAKFLRYVDMRSYDCESAPALFAAAESHPSEAQGVTRSAP